MPRYFTQTHTARYTPCTAWEIAGTKRKTGEAPRGPPVGRMHPKPLPYASRVCEERARVAALQSHIKRRDVRAPCGPGAPAPVPTLTHVAEMRAVGCARMPDSLGAAASPSCCRVCARSALIMTLLWGNGGPRRSLWFLRYCYALPHSHSALRRTPRPVLLTPVAVAACDATCCVYGGRLRAVASSLPRCVSGLSCLS